MQRCYVWDWRGIVRMMPFFQQNTLLMSPRVQFRTISADEAGQRLDNFLLRELKKAPKSLIYRIIRKGEVRINKGRAKPERKLQEGDVVRVPPVTLPDDGEPVKPSAALAERLRNAVLYEDAGLLVINKPAGLAVHGGSGIHLGLVEALRQTRDDHYLELVHRLDRETSGCIMLAKKRSVLRQLHQKLRDKNGVDKQYLALVKGHWSRRRGVVDAPLLRTESPAGDRIVRVDGAGKTAKTAFELVETYADCSLVRAKPITGRTHQIRVHAQHCKHPLVGDDKYGDDAFNDHMRAHGVKRLFLHAASLRFTLDDQAPMLVEAPLPEDLNKVLQSLSGSKAKAGVKD